MACDCGRRDQLESKEPIQYCHRIAISARKFQSIKAASKYYHLLNFIQLHMAYLPFSYSSFIVKHN